MTERVHADGLQFGICQFKEHSKRDVIRLEVRSVVHQLEFGQKCGYAWIE